jgi:hypothetical protein
VPSVLAGEVLLLRGEHCVVQEGRVLVQDLLVRNTL